MPWKKKEKHNYGSPIDLVGARNMSSPPMATCQCWSLPFRLSLSSLSLSSNSLGFCCQRGCLSGPTMDLFWHYFIQFPGEDLSNSRNGPPPLITAQALERAWFIGAWYPSMFHNDICGALWGPVGPCPSL